MMAVGFLMMVHMASPKKIVEQAKIFQEAGADYINLADSSGYLMPDDVKARVAAVREATGLPVGFHSHNNLGLSIANSIAAVEAGAEYVDCTCRGLGAGAGNTQTEVLCAVLQRMGYDTGVDLYDIQDVAEDLVELGRRGMVGGQEDMIIDVAYQLSQKK